MCCEPSCGLRSDKYECIPDALQQGASQFEQQAGKLKRKMWWKNLKVSTVYGQL